MKDFFVVFVIAVASIHVCHGYPSGPPVSTNPDICTTMTPIHGASPQSTQPPYAIEMSPSCFTTGTSIQVTLRGVNGSTFKGFFVQARRPGSNTVSYGTFRSQGDNQVQTLNCSSQYANAIGHRNIEKLNFTSKNFEWALSSTVGNDASVIEFVATVVQNYSTFWVGLQSRISLCTNNSSTSAINSANSSSSTVHAWTGQLTSSDTHNISSFNTTTTWGTRYTPRSTTINIVDNTTTVPVTGQTTSGSNKMFSTFKPLMVVFLLSFVAGLL